MQLTHESIKEMLGSLAYDRALEIHSAGQVAKMNVASSNSGVSIRATVGGSFPYHVEIDIPADDDLLCTHCDCLAYEAFGRCKHIGAVLIEYIREKNGAHAQSASASAKPAPSYLNPLADRAGRVLNNPGASLLLAKYASGTPQLPAEPMRIVPQLQFDKNAFPSAGFTVGSGRQYVIKDLASFLRSVELRETVSYSANFSFAHAPEAFDERSRALIQMISAFLREQKTYMSSLANSSIRIMPLSGRAFDELFELYKGESVPSRESGIRYFMADENPNLSMESEQVDQHVHITVTPPTIAIRGAKHDYALTGNTVYRMTEDYAESMLPLLDVARTSNLLFSPKGASDFCKSVLPVVQKHASLTAPDALLPYLPDKLEVRFYLDLPARGTLTAKPVFAYGDKLLSPTSPDSDYAEVKRDEYHENAAVSALLRHFAPPANGSDEYRIEDEEKMFAFLKDGLKALSEYGVVYVSDRLKNIAKGKKPRISFGVSAGESVLNLNIDSGDLPLSELEELMKAVRQKRKFYRLADGTFMELENSGLDALTKLSDNLGLSEKELEKGEVEVPLSRAMYLDSALKQESDVPFNRDSSFKRMIRDFKTVDDSDYAVPEKLDPVLRNYQKTGYRWLRTLDSYRFGGILADDMGLGKTLQVLTCLLSIKLERKPDDSLPRASLIVCPASLVINWGEEAQKWTEELRVLLLTGDAASREAQLLYKNEYDLIITSYDLLRRDIESHEASPYYACILDEAQYIKNHETQTFRAVKRLKSVVNIALSGTPVENRLSELWSIFDFLMPGYLYKYSAFRDRFENPITRSGDTQAQAALKNLVSPFILRRMKKDVLSELPEKVETVQYVSMEEEQKKHYLAYALEVKRRLESAADGNKLEILSMLTRLRQLCCDPALFIESYAGGSCKLDECLRMVEELTENGHRVLVFSQFTSMLSRIYAKLEEKGIPSFTLRGDTPREERAELVKRFNAGEGSVFLISLKAGGTGLNLTGADTVIHYDPWWNIAAQNQATDRCYRIGQERKVQVYQLIAKDTIEENILKMQSAKRALAESVTEDANGGILSMSRDELMRLIG